MARTYDVIIIGGGIVGCSTAFQLAQRGLDVAIFEKDAIGAGPSGRSSAIIRQHYSNELTARMALYSLGVFQNFEERVGGECGFVQTGFVMLASAKDREGLAANVAMQQSVGVRTELVTPERLKEIMPALNTDELVAAAYEAESGYADPYLTVTSYATAARRKGVKIYQNTMVKSINFDGRKVTGINTDSERFDAPIVLNCAGPWGARVAELAGVEVPINSCRVQVAFFRRPKGYEADHPVVADFTQATYFRSETGGLTLVGLIDPAEADAVVDPDRFNENTDMDFVLDVGERLIERFPAMEESETAKGYASLYDITPDWHPVVDELIPGSGLYICAGFSGHGFKLAPATGVMTADLITGASDPEFDPSMFRLSRYAEKAEVRGQYEYSIAG